MNTNRIPTTTPTQPTTHQTPPAPVMDADLPTTTPQMFIEVRVDRNKFMSPRGYRLEVRPAKIGNGFRQVSYGLATGISAHASAFLLAVNRISPKAEAQARLLARAQYDAALAHVLTASGLTLAAAQGVAR